MKKIIKSLFVLVLLFVLVFQNITIVTYAQNYETNKIVSNEPDPLSNTKNRVEYNDIGDKLESPIGISRNSTAEPIEYPDIIGLGRVTCTTLNVREKPSTSSEVLLTLKQNYTVKILSKNGEWYKIFCYTYEDPNDTSSPKIIYDGYVHSKYISFSEIKEKGIDVSKWNGSIDWNKVKSSGVDYAIIRAGFGSSDIDPKFKANIEGAINAGIKVGVYWFSYANTPERAKKEAEKCLEQIEPYRDNISYPVFFDFEKASADYVYQKYGTTVTQELGTEMAKSFMRTVQEKGYKPGLYTGIPLTKYFSNELLNSSYTWLAHYSYRTTYTKPFYMWQYGDDGKIDGINGPVDVNYTIMDPSVGDIQSIKDISSNTKTSDSISLSWTRIPDASGYELYRLNNQTNLYELISKLDNSSTSYIDRNLSSNTTYSYRIRPYKTVNNIIFYGDYSNILSITTDNNIPNNGDISVVYRSHVQDYGWQDWKCNGQASGTQGDQKRLEAIEIKLNNVPQGADVIYQTHLQDYGWQDWKSNGQMSGTEGESKRIEAIRIQLQNMPGYRIEYRVHVQDYGWQEWKSNGETAGTEGESKRVEAIEIRIVKEKIPSTEYRVHVQDYGWQGWKSNGETAGTEGESKRAEAIEIKLNDVPQGAKIVYQTHVQDYGWQDWKSNGQMSGTEGESKRIEAIRIKLENLPGYRVEYRVHVENYGWQEWKSDGEIAGTSGESKRLESIQIRVVKR